MWWAVSLIALVVLLIGAAAVTFLVMVAMNGIVTIPNAFVVIFFAYTCGVPLALSVLAGLLAKKYSEVYSQPLWVGGILTTIVSLLILPTLLCGLTLLLLLTFDLI